VTAELADDSRETALGETAPTGRHSETPGHAGGRPGRAEPLDLLRRCPSCRGPTWPRTGPDGKPVPRYCVPCQVKIDDAEGRTLL